jgi:hypothetical protein
VIVVLCLLVATALIAGRFGLRLALASDFIVRFDARSTMGAMVLGVASLLVAPSAFAAESVADTPAFLSCKPVNRLWLWAGTRDGTRSSHSRS